MSESIKISPKHGLNSCIPVCIFCGQPKNEIAILGKLKDDAEAPMHAVLDYKPCDECKDNWSKGIALIKVQKTEITKGAPPLTKKDGVDLWPAGETAVISTEAALRILNIDAPAGTPVLIEDTAFDKLMADVKEQESVT